MLNYIKHLHRITVQKVATAFGLPDDLSHHHAHVQQRLVKNVHAKVNRNSHHRQNQRVADRHERHTAEVMAATSWLGKWERFVYKQISRVKH